MCPVDRSGAGTSSRPPDFTAPLRSRFSFAAMPAYINSMASGSASRNRGDSSRAQRVRWRSWGSARDEGRRDRGRHDALPPAARRDRQGTLLRGDEDGPRFCGTHPRRRRHGRLRDRARWLRWRRDERRIPARRFRVLAGTVHARRHPSRHWRRQEHRSLHARAARFHSVRVMAWPVQRLDISPPSDGASAVVLASEDFIRKRRIKDRAWISGVGWCIDSTMWTDRDLVFPEYVARAAKHAYKMAKIDEPRRQIDFAEPYDPFDYKELHHLEGLLLADKGEAPVLTREGVTERDGKMPVCPSGGLLGVGNPIAATMGMKIGELFWQLTGQAGKRQIPHEVHTGVSQAWGDLMQYGSVVVMKG